MAKQNQHQMRRDAAIAAVKAGKISAADAYRTMDGAGSLTRGLLEPYEAEAKVFGNGIWKDLTGTQKTNAMNSMSGLKAAAAANAPKTEAEKAAERALPSPNEMVNQATGYSLASGATGNAVKAEIDALLEERKALTQYANEYGGEVAKKNIIRIEEINDRVNKLNDPAYQRTITPDEAVAWTKFTEGTTNNKPSSNGFWADIVFDATQFGGDPARPPFDGPVDYANLVKGSAAADAALRSLENNPVEREKLIKTLDANMGARVESLTKTIGDTDPTISGSGRMIGGKPDTPWNGTITPTGQAALPAATIGSGAVGTSDAVAKAIVALGKNADPYSVAMAAKQTAIAYGASTDAANNIAAQALTQRGIPLRDALQVASSVPNSVAGTTAGPAAGFTSTVPGVTGTGVTGVSGAVDRAGTVTAEGSTPVAGGLPPTPVAPAAPPVAPVPPVASAAPPVAPVSPVVPPVTGGVPPVVPGAAAAVPAAAAAVGGMSALETTALVTSLVSAGMSVWQANEVAKNAVEAAKIQAAAADKATQLQKDMYDRTRADLAPWRAAGEEALGYTGQQDAAGNWIARPSGGLRTFNQDNADFQMNPFEFRTGMNQNADGSAVADPYADPSYAFRFSEGLKAVENSAAAKGMLRSGNTLKAISDYGQGSASQEYNNAFNRYQTQRTNSFNEHNINRGQKLNVLQSLAGVGQTAVGQTANAGQNYATGGGNAMMNGANVRADGINSAAAATAAGWNGAAAVGNNYLSQALNRSTGLDYAKRFGYGG